MGNVMHQDQIVRRVESLIKQLEELRHTGKTLVAAKICGHIEEGIEVGGLQRTESWDKRITSAMTNVTTPVDTPKPASEDILASLGEPPVQPTNPASVKPADLKPPGVVTISGPTVGGPQL